MNYVHKLRLSFLAAAITLDRYMYECNTPLPNLDILVNMFLKFCKTSIFSCLYLLLYDSGGQLFDIQTLT